MTARSRSHKSKPHPSYPNPTIAEALCELHFALPNGRPWKSTLAGDLFKQIQNDFPEMEPGIEIGLQFELSPQRIGHSVLPARPRMRFKHKERPLLVQLGPNVFTVNVLPKYPGWQKMRQDVLDAWRQASLVLKPAKLTRIGLRYINKVERTKENGTPGDWFKASDFVPKGVLQSKGAFLSRVESQIDGENRVVVTFGEGQQDSENGKKAIVLDIDRILEKDVAVDDAKILTEMDKLHEDIWGIFEAVQAAPLIDYLKGDIQ